MENSLAGDHATARKLIDELRSGNYSPGSEKLVKTQQRAVRLIANLMNQVDALGIFESSESLDDIPTASLPLLDLDYLLALVFERIPIQSGSALAGRTGVVRSNLRLYLDFVVECERLHIGQLVPKAVAECCAQGGAGIYDIEKLFAILRSKPTLTRDIDAFLRLKKKAHEAANMAADLAEKRGDGEEERRLANLAMLKVQYAEAWSEIASSRRELEILNAGLKHATKSQQDLALSPLKPERTLLNAFLKSPPESVVQFAFGNDGPTFGEVHAIVQDEIVDERDEQVAERRRQQREKEFFASVRVDQPNAKNDTSKVLGAGGKIMQPFTLTTRMAARASVYGTGQTLPMLYVEDLATQEMIEAAQARPEPEKESDDEDDHAVADAQTMKQRRWDDFTESNAKGSGNTWNRG